MEIINTVIGTPLGYLMRFLYNLFGGNYGIAIIVFTLCTKIIMFPISLLVQKNSIKMVKMKPELDSLRFQYVDDKDAFIDAQTALYKREHYSPMAGVWPLLLQLPIIFGLLDVVYKPLKHLLHISSGVATSMVARAAQLLNMSVDDLGSTAQLTVVQLIQGGRGAEFADIAGAPDAIDKISTLNMTFLGVNLSESPTLGVINACFLIAVLSGLSALLMCIIQNKINVLQIEQNKLSQWGMTVFMVAFSTFFAFIVPAGVGLYWMWGNLFAILVMYLVNIIYSPKKYINYEALEQMKKDAAAEKAEAKKNKALAKKYYKEFFSKDNQKDMHIVFYSEGSGYYKYLGNIVEELLRRAKYTVHYVTSDPADAIFKKNDPMLRAYYVDQTRLISLMMKLECDIVIMTTPDLEKYHIKRSRVKPNIEYVYVDHGCTSLNLTYRTGALDAFNTVFAVSRPQAIEVRAMERLRHTKKKRIVEYGYGLIDNMIAAYEACDKTENGKKTVLIAPSWQYDNIMDSCLDGLVEGLYNKGYRIVIRPHPQYVRRFPLKMREILEKYRDRFSDDFTIETDFSSNVTVYTADLVITDWSSIAYEFSFTTDKPTLFINTEMKVVNRDYDKIPFTPFDITARTEIGRCIEKSDVASVGDVVAELFENQDSYRDHIHEMKQEYFYNLGHSAEVGADYIIHRVDRKVSRRNKALAAAAQKSRK